MESHAKRKGWWSRPAKALLSLTLVASGFSAAGALSKAEAASGTPGGSIQEPVLWLKANDGAAAAHGGLTGWQDRSPNPVAFTLDLPNGAKVPQYNESGVNFNPSVKFANPLSAYHYNSSAKLLGDKAITFRSGYTVYKWPEDGSAGALVGSSDQKPSNGVIVMGGYGNSVSTGPGEANVYSYVASTIRDRHQLVNYQIGAPGHTASIDGKNTTVTRSVFPAFSFTPSIGATNASAQYNWSGLNAEVAEIILYDTITSADAAKIETYLAVKYGITLDHDYIGTDGTLLWSKTANAAYHHNVAGLGKDILEELDQKQSRSINKDTQVAIGLGGLAEANSGNTALLADGQYLIWGDNGKLLKFTEQRGSTDWYQAQRIWKVQNNGDVGEVEIAIPAAAAPEKVKLLVSDSDTDFSQATEYALNPIQLGNAAHYAVKLTLKDGQYFTFAAEAPELQYALLEQIAEDGHEIVLAFDQEMTTGNLAGFSVQIGGTAVPIGSLTYRVDSADSKKLILTLPEGTDVKGKTVNVAYDGTGSLKSTYGAPAKPFTVSPRDQFIDSLKITQPAGSTVNVPKPEITGEAEEGSAVAIVIRDKDGQIVTGAGGNAVVEADGTWSFTPGSDLHDGEYTVEATAIKGVKSAVATKGITVNLPVPAIEITAPGGETVTDPKPEFQGTTDPGATVTAVIKDEDGQTIGTPAVTVNADGTWSFKPEVALPYGKYTVEVTSAKNGKTNMASKTITLVDKSKLQAEVNLSSTLDEEDYTPGSWTSYESKLTTAQAVLASATATQAEVDAALAELSAAREALVLKPDKSKLQAEVDLSSTLDEEDYTPGSWTSYESKLTTAQAVLVSATATQAEVDTALAELTAAREALVLKPVVDKSKLQAEVDLSSELDEEDYTIGSWTSYASKLTTAQAVLGNATATQAEVDTALAELTAAREALVLKPDKSKLQAEVDQSSTLVEEDYTPGSWTSYESKLTTAQAVLTSSTATQAEVDTALAELTAAREALVLKPVVDKSKLQAEVDQSSTLVEEDYTPGSWTSYESKLTTAQAVLTSSTATQAEVDTALAELTAAREALVLKPVVDKSKLQAEVDVSSTLNEEDYTPGSWTNYESKLTTAQAVLGNATATQAEVDTALAELTAAREALVLKPVVDKSKLQAEVDLSSTLDEEDYTPGSWTNYESKLTTTQAVLVSATATQAEVDTALAELTAAREALVLKPVVDKSKLQAEVNLSSTLDEEDYTTGSWTSYASKLTTAQAVLGNATATQAEVDMALAELTAARDALVLKPDKSKLQAEVDVSSTLVEEDYTTGSWTNYESKLTTAQAVLGNATATQAEVDTALAELTAAREALVLKPVVDKSKLQAEVDVSSTLDEEDYTPGSWTSYESKLTTAQAVLVSATATQAEVDTALAELTAAREALVLKPVVDKSKLQAEVDLCSTLDEEDYTPGSWTDYASKLTTAQAVLGSPTATQAEVDTALTELTAALEALVLKPVVDKSKLQAEVDVSSTLDEEDYTPGSWTNYESKLTTAQAVLGNATATQAEVDTALAELTAAREALVLKPVVDKSKLQAEVDVSSTLDEEDYTPGSWTNYESKLTTTQAVLVSATATQAEVDTALAELTAAREALVLKPVVDKSKLQAEVNLSSTLDEEDYTTGSWTSYASKLTTAQAVLGNATATQAEVDTALAELTAAREALVLKPVVDKSKLQAEVDLSSTLDEEDYTPGSWTSYKSKLTTAQAVLTSSTATQAEVDTALAELTAAREALVLKPVVDKSKLQAEVNLSSELDEEDYTPGSWTNYESKLTTAQAVLGNATATQAEVDTALAELTAAREALVLKPVVPVVDKSKLQAGVDLSAILDKETYTSASWTSYESILTDAQAVLASATATQAEVDAALEALQAAYRALVPKSGLASITPSAGVIQPNVTASVYEYSLNVEYNVSELQLTLAAAHPDAAITVNGQAAGTGQASAAVTLNVGDNTVTIVVRETDGSEKTYTVTVRRQSAPFEPTEPSQTPYVPSNTPTPALPVIERITVDVEAIGYGIVVKTEIERTTNNDGSKSDKVTFTTAKALEAVEKTLAAHSPSVRIVIPDKQDIVKDVRVELPDAAVKAVQEAGLNLEIYTDNGMITIPNASLSGLNPNLYFHLIPVKQESERKQVEERARTEEIVRKALNNGNVYVVDRPITIETNMTSRPVTITLPLDSSHVPAEASAREAYLSKLAVFIEHSDGERELVKPAIVTYGDNKLGLTFTIGKFSTFTILNLDNGGAESHQAYMVGMPDGTFKPENAMTRAQVAMILYRVLELQGTGKAARYSDVAGSHWAAEAIRQVTAAGLMKGMTDGSFRPEQSITRAEIAVIIARWKALSGTGEHSYNDALGHWAEKAIGQTKEAGYMEGMLDGSFQPNKALTRAEGVTVFNRILERGPLYGESIPVWTDVPTSHWAFHQIEEASQDHSYTSRPEGGEMIIKQ